MNLNSRPHPSSVTVAQNMAWKNVYDSSHEDGLVCKNKHAGRNGEPAHKHSGDGELVMQMVK